MGGYFAQVLLVGCGGFLGSAARFMLGGWIQRLFPAAGMPLGTLAVNVLGCLLIGLLSGTIGAKQSETSPQVVFLMVGVLGGFTTFSTFSHETLELIRQAELLRAAGNVALQVVLGLGAAWLGFALARSG